MTNEEKQALIEHCKQQISHYQYLLENFDPNEGQETEDYPGYIQEWTSVIKVHEIALAALTAPPVRRPKNIGPGYASVALSTRDQQWYDAIGEAGHEVQE